MRCFGQPAVLFSSWDLVLAAFKDEATFPSAEFYGNTVTTDTGSVALAKASGPAAGSLSCTATTVSAVAGVATFAGCKITAIEQNLVTLDANGQALELRVGYLLRRVDDGPWQTREAERVSDYGSSYSSSSSGYGSSSSFGSSSYNRDSRYGSSSSYSSRDPRYGSSSSSSSGRSSSGESPQESALRRMREQDKNGDGKISWEEADDRLKPRFREMDKNNDGFVDLEELRKHVDDRTAALAGLTHRMDMQDHVVAFGPGTLDLAPGVRKLFLEERHQPLEALDPVGSAGVVLDVMRPEILGCGLEVLLVEGLVVEIDHDLLVGLRIGRKGRSGEQQKRNREEGGAHQ